MHRPFYDIVLDDTASIEWLNCRLMIVVNPGYLYFIVLGKDSNVVALRFYKFKSKNYSEMTVILEQIMEDDGILKQNIGISILVYNWPECCLVPKKYADASIQNNMLELVHGDLHKGIIYHEDVPAWDLAIVYRVPRELQELFQSRFPTITHRHYYALWLEWNHKAQERKQDGVALIFYPSEMLAVVISQQQLQVIQSFSYQTAEDIAWQVLNIYQRFNLNQSETPLFIGGMIEEQSSMYKELLKYFLIVNNESLPEGLSVSEHIKTFPQHFFSPVLNLALCVL